MSGFTKALRRLQDGFCTAVVVAAGVSSRMGEDKLFLTVGGRPVLALTLSALNRCPDIQEIVLVARPEQMPAIGAIRAGYRLEKLTKVVFGGATRTESALAGVTAASKKAKLICIHDGARPFVTPALASEVIRCAGLYQAAAPALPLKDTVKRADRGVVAETPDRNGLFAVQTPQAFWADVVKGALTAAVRSGTVYTDDCAAAEALGVHVRLIEGDEDNIKLTTPRDLEAAELIYARRREAAE